MQFKNYANSIKEKIADKMKRKVPYLHDIPDTGKFKKGHGIYERGGLDKEVGIGHGRYKNQGLTNYINDMLKNEKEGKVQFDTRRK